MSNQILKEKFNQNAKLYDKQRKLVIPCLDDLYNIIVELARSEIPGPKILDIGAGTGLLTYHLFKRYTRAKFTLIDLSDEMLNIAKQRFADKPNFKFITSDYLEYDFKDKFDIITSSLSIHHLKDEDKKFIYTKVYETLKEGGIFLNADQVLAPNTANELEYHRNWREKIEDGSLKEGEKKFIIDRMKLDRPATLEDNLKWLKNSGFKNVDVFYKYYNFVVLYGKKITAL
jgi:tRNA (cmo5U34)-methyltransferase